MPSSSDDEAALPALFADLDLELVVGSLMLFGPRRGGYVLVRQVRGLGARCSTCSSGWCRPVPDPRVRPVRATAAGARTSPWPAGSRADQVAPVARRAGRLAAELTATVRHARRWDGDRRQAWLITVP